ncbi:MAG: tetratricopeptide repeat protein [Vicinamibacteria bacterium]
MRPAIPIGLVLLLFSAATEAKETWLEAKSANFSLVTEVGKGRAEDILTDLEQLRRLVTRSLPSQPVDSPIPTGIYVFKNEKSLRDFQPLREGKPEEWAAFFQPQPFKNFIALQAEGSKEFVRELVFQQYLHLLLSYRGISYPLWLRSGLSLFYGNAYITKDRAEVGKMHERHRRELGEYRSMPFQQLFSVTRDSREYRDENMRPLFDAQAWALVHYLIIGRSPEGGQAIGRFLDLLAEGKDEMLAFQEAMKMPVGEVQAAVSQYIRKSVYQYWKVELEPLEAGRDFRFTELSPAAADARLGGLLIAVGRLDEARKRLESAVEAAPDLPEGYENLGFLYTLPRSPEKALPFLERAAEKGSTNPILHYQYAATLLDAYRGTASQFEEPARSSAKSALAKTLASDPSHPDAARLFGFLCLFDGSAQEGVSVVKKALEANDGHPQLLFILGQLYGRQENYSAARAIYEHLLSRKLEPEMVAGIRQQLDYVVGRMAANP